MKTSLLYLTLLLLAGCQKDLVHDEVLVARVGDRGITADEFVMNYEFGFTHLKQGEDPRRAYLERMIDEKLLALEGYRLRLDTLAGVRRRLKSQRDKLLVEAVFDREVNARVVVSDDDVRRLMQRDRVRFKLRYLPAPTRAGALLMRSAVLERGFDQVLSEFQELEESAAYRAADFESPLLHWYDISPTLLEAIEDLALHEVSQPVAYRGSYLLLEVVEVLRDPMTPISDPAEVERYRQVAFQREAKKRARDYIGRSMKPINLRMKGSVFGRFRTYLWEVFRHEPVSDDLFAVIQSAPGAEGDSLRSLLEAPLFTTSTETWTVFDFAKAYPLDRYPLNTRAESAFSGDLYDAVGLTLRDRTFVEKAEAARLDESPEFLVDYMRWADKWLYRAAVRHVVDSLEGSLDSYLTELRRSYNVEVFTAVLDTLELQPVRGPSEPNILLLERHSGQPAVPVVDPWWGRGAGGEDGS